MKRGLKISLAAVLLLAVAAGVVWYSMPIRSEQTVATFGVSYPNEADKTYAAAQGKSPGGLIKIHGIKNGWGSIGKRHLQRDWTDGCIAVTDEEIDELYRSVKHNAEIEILP